MLHRVCAVAAAASSVAGFTTSTHDKFDDKELDALFAGLPPAGSSFKDKSSGSGYSSSSFKQMCSAQNTSCEPSADSAMLEKDAKAYVEAVANVVKKSCTPLVINLERQKEDMEAFALVWAEGEAMASLEGKAMAYLEGEAMASLTSGRDGQERADAVRAFVLGHGFDCDSAAGKVIRLSPLQHRHQHVLQPKSLVRPPDFLCIATGFSNGSICMVRRGGDRRPPASATHFFQQLMFALEICHERGVCICKINPSNLLIFWDNKGMPILKTSDFRALKDMHVEGPGQNLVVAPMDTCPPMIYHGGRIWQPWECLAAVCSVWLTFVMLFSVLTGRWPFYQGTAWAAALEDNWNDDIAMGAVVGTAVAAAVGAAADFLHAHTADAGASPFEGAPAVAGFVTPGSAPSSPAGSRTTSLNLDEFQI